MPGQAERGRDAIVFAGECSECDRTVAARFPYESQFLEIPAVRIACAECGHPTFCQKQI